MLSGRPISLFQFTRRGRDLGVVNESVGLVDEGPAAGRWRVGRRAAAHVDGGHFDRGSTRVAESTTLRLKERRGGGAAVRVAAGGAENLNAGGVRALRTRFSQLLLLAAPAAQTRGPREQALRSTFQARFAVSRYSPPLFFVFR